MSNKRTCTHGCLAIGHVPTGYLYPLDTYDLPLDSYPWTNTRGRGYVLEPVSVSPLLLLSQGSVHLQRSGSTSAVNKDKRDCSMQWAATISMQKACAFSEMLAFRLNWGRRNVLISNILRTEGTFYPGYCLHINSSHDSKFGFMINGFKVSIIS